MNTNSVDGINIQILTKSIHIILTVTGVFFIFRGNQIHESILVIIGVILVLASTLIWYYHITIEYRSQKEN